MCRMHRHSHFKGGTYDVTSMHAENGTTSQCELREKGEYMKRTILGKETARDMLFPTTSPRSTMHETT